MEELLKKAAEKLVNTFDAEKALKTFTGVMRKLDPQDISKISMSIWNKDGDRRDLLWVSSPSELTELGEEIAEAIEGEGD